MAASPQPRVDSLLGVAETCLFTFSARLEEARRPDALFQDPVAEAIARRLEWDVHGIGADWLTRFGVAMRTEILDEATRAFLTRHAGALVINLGAGLCTRFFRVDDGYVEWIDLDLPTVIDLKRQVVEESERYRLVSGSALDPTWMEQIRRAPGQPLLLIAEGLLEYLQASQVKSLITTLSTDFRGAEMFFQAVSPLAVRLSSRLPSVAKTSARVSWGLLDPAILSTWAPGIRFIEEWHYDRHPRRLGWVRGIHRIPWVRKSIRIVHVAFDD